VQAIVIPVQSMASALDSLIGELNPPAAPTRSQGPGTGGGAGDGTGPGDGPGSGPGLGPGRDGNTGGGGYRIGSGVTSPIEIRRGVPQYTSDAMRARIQGSFIIECVVQTDGVCTNIRILRAIDPSFGLNDEAIKAAQQWRFRPGTLRGEPVPVRVTLEIGFSLR
jgi:protein TonB